MSDPLDGTGVPHRDHGGGGPSREDPTARIDPSAAGDAVIHGCDGAAATVDARTMAREGMRAGAERAGDRIGTYTLVSEIGRGGFGEVWLAERREPMLQRVAIKLIRVGMDSKPLLARFERERQALAVMDHPNVARVYDGGVAPSGRPYFVMEYVSGKPITAFCDEERLTVRERIGLIVAVCDAVQHAHHKGIVHRDVTSRNVLVDRIDGSPVVKVIDFGVAKATDDSAAHAGIESVEGVPLGTPAYMSPEQAGGSADIDSRTDVYSIGVLLYEVLVGRLPFEPSELRRRGIDEMLRVIREEDPPAPSTRISSIGDSAAAVAATRRHSPASLARELRRELEWIPLKAMRKQRERRYGSPAELAEDLRRYLDGRALNAGPESRVYLARKFVTRHRALVLSSLMVLVAVSAGLAGTYWQWQEAESQRDEARQQAERAEQNAESARARAHELTLVSEFQTEMLSQITIGEAGRRLLHHAAERFERAVAPSEPTVSGREARSDTFRQDLLRVNPTDLAATLIDETILRPSVSAIERKFADQPLVDAQLRHALATQYRMIGLYESALKQEEAALELRRQHLGDDDPRTLEALNDLGGILMHLSRHEDALLRFRQAHERRRRVLGEEDRATLESLNNVASALGALGNHEEAEPLQELVAEVRRRVLGADDPHTLTALNNLAFTRAMRGDTAASASMMSEVLNDRIRVLGPSSTEVIESLNNLGYLLRAAGDLAGAERRFRAATEAARSGLGGDHPLTLLSLNNLGVALRDRGKITEAEALLKEAYRLRRRQLGEHHVDTLISLQNFAGLLQGRGRNSEAVRPLLEALEGMRRVKGNESQETLQVESNLAAAYFSLGRFKDAVKILDDSLPRARKVLVGGHAPRLATMLSIVGRARVHSGYDEASFMRAEEELNEALAILRDLPGQRGPEVGYCIQALVELHAAWHRAVPDAGHDAKVSKWKQALKSP